MAPAFESAIDLDLPEAELVTAINHRLHQHRMELVSSMAAFGEEINFGKWFVRGRKKPGKANPNPWSYLVQRRVQPSVVAANLNLGVLPR